MEMVKEIFQGIISKLDYLQDLGIKCHLDLSYL